MQEKKTKDGLFSSPRFVGAVVLVLCALLSITFPADVAFQTVAKVVFFLVVLPLVYGVFIGGVPSINFSPVDPLWRRHGVVVFATIFSAIVCVWVLFVAGLLSSYTLPTQTLYNDFWFFVFYHVFILTPFLFAYEVYFRFLWQGLLMDFFVFYKPQKNIIFSAAIQMGLFALYVAIIAAESTIMEYLPLLLAAPFATFIALYTRSIWWTLLFSWCFWLFFDTITIVGV